MTTRYCALSFLLGLAACDPLANGDDDDGGAATSDDGASDDADASDDASGSDDTDPSDDDSGVDDTGGVVPGDALPDSVFVYLHDEGSWADSVRAYDVATGESWVITDLGGDVQIRSVAIDPTRTSLALSAFYESVDPDESEGIWRLAIDGGTPEPIMAPIDGAAQDIADLTFAYDGSEIWFGYSSGSGGGLVGSVSASGGEPTFFGDGNDGCISQFAPAPSPSGEQLVVLRDGCMDIAKEGLVLHSLPPADAGVVLVGIGDITDLMPAAPQWSADASAMLFVMNTRIDTDGDGFYDGGGDMVVLYDTVEGQLYELVPAAINQTIRNFALSPDETRIALCMGSAAGEDLVLMDLSGEAPSYTTLTSDGHSCRPAW